MSGFFFKAIFLLFGIKFLSAFTFDEELSVEYLTDSFVYLHFTFKSVWNKSSNETNSVQNYQLFPKSLATIFDKFQIEENYLTVTQGTWKYESWGFPRLESPTGSELWSRFSEGLSKNTVDENWLISSRAISGLFGLSINLQDNPRTVEPKYESDLKNQSSNLRYAAIPNEIVCTENLTPWIKLLPCLKNKGLAQLLRNSHKLFESQYLSMALGFQHACKDGQKFCENPQLELVQTLSLVYNTELFRNFNVRQESSWSFSSVFGQKIDGACPVASTSYVFMNLGTGGSVNNVQATKNLEFEGKKVKVFDVRKILSDFDHFNPTISMRESDDNKKTPLPISIHRYFTNANERNFGMKILIENKLPVNCPIVYFDTIPWHFRVYMSSLKIKNEHGTKIEPSKIYFMPGSDRKKPHHIELAFNLEANTKYTIYFRVEYAFLKWNEFPPDVHHGFYINPAYISINASANPQVVAEIRGNNIYARLDSIFESASLRRTKELKLYTETLLMNLPVPDFSMPYNVICLTCTVIAIAFGSLHNFTTRRFLFIESKTFRQKLAEKLSAFLRKFKKSNK